MYIIKEINDIILCKFKNNKSQLIILSKHNFTKHFKMKKLNFINIKYQV